MSKLTTIKGEIIPSLNRSTFPIGEPRAFANNFVPVRKMYDDVYVEQNQKNAPLQEGRYVQTPGKLDPNQVAGGRFSTMPVRQKGSGLPEQANNFDPSIRAPIDKVYWADTRSNRYLQPLHSKIMGPIQAPIGTLQHGGSYATLRHHGGSNPAINNVFPGTKIPEPMRVYEYSTGSQFRSLGSDPIPKFVPSKGLSRDKLSEMDGIPLHQTADAYNQGQFRHISHNPLLIRG